MYNGRLIRAKRRAERCLRRANKQIERINQRIAELQNAKPEPRYEWTDGDHCFFIAVAVAVFLSFAVSLLINWD